VLAQAAKTAHRLGQAGLGRDRRQAQPRGLRDNAARCPQAQPPPAESIGWSAIPGAAASGWLQTARSRAKEADCIRPTCYLLCPHCGGRSEIFSHGGARLEAERLGTEFLGEAPLDLRIRETSDSGHPITVSDPGNPHSAVFRAIAARIWEKGAGAGAVGRAPPRIVIE
jgi:NUBPL iron-transfer P-loop NTPase